MKYLIPCVWQMAGDLEIEAESLDAALDEANSIHVGLPKNGEYIDGSFNINYDCIDIANNKNI